MCFYDNQVVGVWKLFRTKGIWAAYCSQFQTRPTKQKLLVLPLSFHSRWGSILQQQCLGTLTKLMLTTSFANIFRSEVSQKGNYCSYDFEEQQ